ncbi:cobalt transporter CbiM [Desulfosporosinus sp. FKB]|uniref:cobalt transporter CbiM n=1 Tax=Desulfosporosinus sp. FKB TaxID=1969835 RepID=UPI001FA8491B|nr:cobalt transporter CbiM [Desulfosporosinus sp. FKB]
MTEVVPNFSWSFYFTKEELFMHIPDGYLSPQTDAVLGLISASVLAAAAKKTSKTFSAKNIPLLSIGAAFSFTIMMFNVPIPDGTTAHAIGGSLLAILFGPWTAAIGVTIALVIQAIFFGDGGILALGANIFNMGIILPFVSYAIFSIIAGKSEISSKRRWIGAAIAGYIGLTVAAVSAGTEFGLQPLLFHSANGTHSIARTG